jgi:hypothetical protein
LGYRLNAPRFREVEVATQLSALEDRNGNAWGEGPYATASTE